MQRCRTLSCDPVPSLLRPPLWAPPTVSTAVRMDSLRVHPSCAEPNVFQRESCSYLSSCRRTGHGAVRGRVACHLFQLSSRRCHANCGPGAHGLSSVILSLRVAPPGIYEHACNTICVNRGVHAAAAVDRTCTSHTHLGALADLCRRPAIEAHLASAAPSILHGTSHKTEQRSWAPRHLHPRQVSCGP